LKGKENKRRKRERRGGGTNSIPDNKAVERNLSLLEGRATQLKKRKKIVGGGGSKKSPGEGERNIREGKSPGAV